jgi:hypothetical protein
MWLIFLPLTFIIIIPLLLYGDDVVYARSQTSSVMPIRWIPEPPTLLNFRKIFADPLIPLARWFSQQPDRSPASAQSSS